MFWIIASIVYLVLAAASLILGDFEASYIACSLLCNVLSKLEEK
jgi:hypothetical protein